MHVEVRDAGIEIEIEKLKTELAAIKKVYEKLVLEYERLRRSMIGPRREQAPKAQSSLLTLLEGMMQLQKSGDVDEAQALLDRIRAGAQPDADADANADAQKQEKKKKPKKTPHGRRLHRMVDQEVIIEPAERLAPGGELLERIGEDTHVVLFLRSMSITSRCIARSGCSRVTA